MDIIITKKYTFSFNKCLLKRSLLSTYFSIIYLILIFFINKKGNSLIRSELLIVIDIIIDDKLNNKRDNW